MLSLLLTIGAAHGRDCERQTELAELRTTIEAAVESYTLGDRPSLEAGVRELERIVPCLGNPIERTDAARLHLALALLAWDPASPEAADPYLSAAHALAKDQDLRDWGLDDEDPLTLRWAALSAEPDATRQRLPPPAAGRLSVDGEPDSRRPSNRPYMLQLARSGQVLAGGYVHLGEAPPPYPRARPRLALASAALGAASAGCLLGGLRIYQEMERSRPGSYEEWKLRYHGQDDGPESERLKSPNNALLVSGLVLGVGSIGALGAIVVVSF